MKGNMEKIIVTVEMSINNYAAFIELLPGCVATGKTFEELQTNMKNAIELHLETSNEYGDKIPEPFQADYELIYKFDAKSLLHHYRGIFTNSALERLTGINQRQLQRYAAGESKPRPEQTARITKALHSIGKELLVVEM